VGSFVAPTQGYRKWINDEEIRRFSPIALPRYTWNKTIRIVCRFGGWVCLTLPHSTGEMGSFRRGGQCNEQDQEIAQTAYSSSRNKDVPFRPKTSRRPPVWLWSREITDPDRWPWRRSINHLSKNAIN